MKTQNSNPTQEIIFQYIYFASLRCWTRGSCLSMRIILRFMEWCGLAAPCRVSIEIPYKHTVKPVLKGRLRIASMRRIMLMEKLLHRAQLRRILEYTYRNAFSCMGFVLRSFYRPFCSMLSPTGLTAHGLGLRHCGAAQISSWSGKIYSRTAFQNRV